MPPLAATIGPCGSVNWIFSQARASGRRPLRCRRGGRATPGPASLNDDALVAGIPEAGLALAPALAAEAARRGLLAAVPALEHLCNRLAGFGHDREVPEQVAALDALAQIGGAAAANAVLRILSKNVVLGPTLATAVAAAVRLGIVLPEGKALILLRHADPLVRAYACRCAPFRPATVAELLDDLNVNVATAAACALGRMGQVEARAALLHRLRQAPTAEIIDAISEVVGDDSAETGDAIVLLGRIARSAVGCMANFSLTRGIGLQKRPSPWTLSDAGQADVTALPMLGIRNPSQLRPSNPPRSPALCNIRASRVRLCARTNNSYCVLQFGLREASIAARCALIWAAHDA